MTTLSALLLTVALQAPASASKAPGWLDRSPHTSAMVPVSGLSLHYLDWNGSGEPLLLLAGLFGSAHAFDDLAPRLTPRFRVIALTRRGSRPI